MDYLYSLKKERNYFPAACKQVYFESASTGLVPTYIQKGVQKYQSGRVWNGGDAVWNGMDTFTMIDNTKKKLAQMLNCDTEDIFFGLNSSHVYTTVSAGFQFRPGENIIIPRHAWLGNRFAWQMREKEGLEIRYADSKNGEIRIQDIETLIDKKTKAVCVNMVDAVTGFRCDMYGIGQLCRHSGVYFIVDGVQAAGVLQIDVKKMHIDFLAFNDYKWMLGFCGTGVGYISPELQREVCPLGAGWYTDIDLEALDKERLQMKEDAGRYETGYPNVSGIYALGESAGHYLQIGGEVIENHVMDLSAYLEEQILETKGVALWHEFHAKNCSQIINIVLDSNLGIDRQDLLDAGIVAQIREDKALQGKKLLRIGLHYYNCRADIDYLMKFIRLKYKEAL